MPIEADLQKPSQDSALIELFVIDCTGFGGTVYRFTPHFADSGTITFAGNIYTSIPITSDGWEVTATGNQPRPTLTISNVNQTLLNAVITLGDIVGAKVTRIRTLRKHLADGSNPDGNAFLQPDIYTIEQKTAHNKNLISWQLSSVIDKFGTKIPKQQITRDRFPGVGRGRGAW